MGGGGERCYVSSELSLGAPVDSSNHNTAPVCLEVACPVQGAGGRLREGEAFSEGLGVSV